MTKSRGDILACGLWVAAFALMAFGTLDSDRMGHNSPFLAWGIFLAVVACVPTGAMIIRAEREKEDVSVEHIIEVVDALHEGKRELTRLH